jgi:hypothetical protein
MLFETNNQSKKILNFNHLSQVEETYLQHLKFSLWAGIVLLILGVVSIIHGVFPFLLVRYPDNIYRYFVKNSQKRIDRVNQILKKKNFETD